MATPKIGRIHRSAIIAGNVNYTAEVTYPGEPMHEVTFAGSTYGEPGTVVMITEALDEIFVDDPSRFGARFDANWVRRFFA